MKKLRIGFIIVFLTFIAFFVKGQKEHIVYADSSTSKMVVTNIDSDEKRAITYSLTKTNYSVEDLTINGESVYFAVKKTSQLGGEGRVSFNHLISADFTPMSNDTLKAFSIRCNCNDIIPYADFYETITYGCCDVADVTTYYSYENQKEICESDMGIIHYSIQHPKIDCYIGFSTESHGITDNRGTLYIGYSTGKLYKIKIISPFFPPAIRITTGDPHNPIDSTRYQSFEVYSLDRVHSIDQINDMKISLVFNKYKAHYVVDKKVIDIPIINGKPFGKDETEQTIEVQQ